MSFLTELFCSSSPSSSLPTCCDNEWERKCAAEKPLCDRAKASAGTAWAKVGTKNIPPLAAEGKGYEEWLSVLPRQTITFTSSDVARVAAEVGATGKFAPRDAGQSFSVTTYWSVEGEAVVEHLNWVNSSANAVSGCWGDSPPFETGLGQQALNHIVSVAIARAMEKAGGLRKMEFPEKRVRLPTPLWVGAGMSSLLDLGGSETTECHTTSAMMWEREAKVAVAAFVEELKRGGLL